MLPDPHGGPWRLTNAGSPSGNSYRVNAWYAPVPLVNAVKYNALYLRCLICYFVPHTINGFLLIFKLCCNCTLVV